MSLDTVGTLLASIANLLADGLRDIRSTDSSLWGQDEHEQVRAIEATLDEAKKDFQELAPLVNGQVYYQNDRNHDSLDELRSLVRRFQLHTQDFADWAAAGGPINPIWALETHDLRRELHRAQCKAVARIFSTEQLSEPRCLGAFLVHRHQRLPPCNHDDVDEYRRRQREELAACNSAGKFERLGDRDIAFVCDFCDGYLVWEDLEGMPSVRTVDEAFLAAEGQPAAIPPAPVGAGVEHWQATGFAVTTHEEKAIVFAPLAVGNHLSPETGAWQSRILCPFCDGGYAPAQGSADDGVEAVVGYGRDERGFEDLKAFREHLEWAHTALPRPSLPVLPVSTSNCVVM